MTASDTNPDADTAHGWRIQRLVFGSLLVLLTLLVFAQVGNHEFINFDDGAYVTENPHVLGGLSAENLVWAFSSESTEVTGNWHPLTWLSLMLDAQVFGTGARGFHLVNLLLHIANVLLLYSLLLEMSGNCLRSAFVAAVFAVHPLHVESVAWISERKDVLSTFFGLLAIRWYIARVRGGPWHWHALSLAAFACSLLAKQMLVTLPFLLLLLDYWPLQRQGMFRIECENRQSTIAMIRMCWRLIHEKAGYFVLAIVFSMVAYLSQQRGGAVGSFDEYPLLSRCLNAVVVYGLYLWKTVWPAGLGVFYPYPEHNQFAGAVAAGVVLLLLSGAVWRLRSRHPWLIVGWLWYLGTLVPVIGIVQIGRQQMADRYMYVPMIGLLIAIAWGIAEASRESVWRRRILQGSAVTVVITLAAMAACQTKHWQDSMSLFTHTLTVSESSLAHTKVGYEYASLGQFTSAGHHFSAALRINPDYAPAHRSRGNAFLAQGRIPEAMASLRKAIELDSEDAEAHYNLGIVLSVQGEFAAAIEHYERSLSIAPGVPEVHVNLAAALAMLGRYDSAIQHFKRALDLAPEMTQAHFNLANTLAAVGETSAAIHHYQHVVATDPEILEARIRLASLHLEQGERQLAIPHLEYVLNRQPLHEDARELLHRASPD